MACKLLHACFEEVFACGGVTCATSVSFFSYKGPLLEDGVLRSTLEKGLHSDVFIDTVITICSELKDLYSLQEAVSRPQGPADADSFQLEMRSFLQELQCPHESLKELDLLSSFKKKLLLVDFLVSELLTARILKVKKKDSNGVEAMEVDGATGVHSVSANLKAILRAYGINEPPPNITVRQVYDKIIGKVSIYPLCLSWCYY